MQEVDIWSFGCLLLEILTLRIPYQGLPDSEIYDLIMVRPIVIRSKLLFSVIASTYGCMNV
jgi:serine/threonine protein kinase